MNSIAYLNSPIGWIEISGDEEYVSSVSFVIEGKEDSAYVSKPVINCKVQLVEFFECRRKEFSVPLSQSGTDFQKKVWAELERIPFGKTISYQQLAKKLGDPKCIRAAGTANGRNKIAIIVPCHRVIGSNGTLVGYAGGLDKKKWLLEHEASISGQQILAL
jgi:methylated-DNA-[protein]-cysteine S-methyltransferase